MSEIEDDDQQPNAYMSYNGLGRTPMLWGIPYMAGLTIMCLSLLPAMFLGIFISGAGWLFALIGVPLVIFAKSMCSTDDKALLILSKEIKWALLKSMGGNARLYGGAFMIAPTSYTRKTSDVTRGIEASIRR
jgi:type IV secretion system protein VirB3